MKLRLSNILDKKFIIIWLFYFFFITTAFFMYHEPFNSLYPIIRYGRCVIALYLSVNFLIIRRFKVSSIYAYTFIFCSILLVSSLAGDLNLASWINIFLLIFGCLTFVDFYKKQIHAVIKIGFWYFFLVVLVNNIFMYNNPLYLFIVQNELGNQMYHFAASKNQFSMFTIPLLFFGNLAYDKKIINKSIFIISLIQAIIPAILVVSVTSIIGTILFEVIMLSKDNHFLRSKKMWFTILLIVYVMQLLFTYIFRGEFFQYIVVEYLMKDPTLSGRAMIWDAAHELISHNPFLGMGNGKNGSYYYSVVDGYQYGSIMWAHNTSLDLLTQGGTFLYISYFAILVTSINHIFKSKRKINKDNIIFLAVLLIYGLMGYTERFNFRLDTYLIMFFAYFIPKYHSI